MKNMEYPLVCPIISISLCKFICHNFMNALSSSSSSVKFVWSRHLQCPFKFSYLNLTIYFRIFENTSTSIGNAMWEFCSYHFWFSNPWRCAEHSNTISSSTISILKKSFECYFRGSKSLGKLWSNICYLALLSSC